MEAPGSILANPSALDKVEDTKIWNLPVQEPGMTFYSILSIYLKMIFIKI